MAQLRIFLSYAREDQRFADAIAERLTSAFRRDVELKYMSQFPLGVNYRELIDRALDDSDILLVIATGREKLSHSFTGYEVGFFRKSQQGRKYMDEQQHIERLIIPFAMLTEIPGPISDIQGLGIAETDRFLFDQGLATRRPSEEEDPFFRLLVRIDGIVDKLEHVERPLDRQARILDEYRAESISFYQALGKLMSSMPRHTDYPETRLTLRLPVEFSSTDIDLERGVMFACKGPTDGMFEKRQPEQWVPWSDFSERIGSKDIALTWNDALRSLVASAVTGDLAHSDQLVFSCDQKKLFRLFISKSTTFFDGARELDIYVVEKSRDKEFGDPFTTYLANAIAISLRYRSLFLEAGSPYGHVIVRFCRREAWKPTVKQMLRELRLLIVRSRESGLGEQRYIVELFREDKEGVQCIGKMMKIWFDQKTQLYEHAEAFIAETEPTEASFEAFLKTLTGFCDRTKEISDKFTTTVLQRLADILKTG